MNKHASVTVHGNAGPETAAENMMSGRVTSEASPPRRRGASAPRRSSRSSTAMRSSYPLRNLAEGRRYRGGRQRRQLSPRSWQAGGPDRDLRRRRGRARRFIVRSGHLTCAARCARSAFDARFEPMTDADRAAVEACSRNPALRTTPRNSDAWRQRRVSIRCTPMPIRSIDMTGPQLEESAGFDRSTIDYIQRAAASSTSMRSGDWGPNAASRISTICCFLPPRCRATPSKATGNAA